MSVVRTLDKLSLTVKVSANAKVPAVVKEEAWVRVAVKEPAKENKANQAVIQAIADQLDVPTYSVSLVKG